MVKHEEAVRMLAAERYVLEELGGEERERFEEHFFVCPVCARDVEQLSLLCATVREAGARLPGREEAVVGWGERIARWWALPQVGMAAASALVLMMAGVGYQMTRPGGGAPEAEALAGYMLMPETRGEAVRVRIPAGAERVLVEVDLPGARGKLRWALASSDGEGVMMGEGAAPTGGASWKLLLPVRKLREGSYLLTVSEAESGRNYRFPFQTQKN